MKMEDYTAGKPWKIAKQKYILETAYQLFSKKGIMTVSIPEISVASGVGRATVFRYFGSKLGLVVAIGTWKWEEYMESSPAGVSREMLEKMTAAEQMRLFIQSFLDLYQNHPDILRFSYESNSYLRHEEDASQMMAPYNAMVAKLAERFHEIYERGMRDGTLNPEIPEQVMFSGSFHILLAAVTRYAVGLADVPKAAKEPKSELIMLGELLLAKFTREAAPKNREQLKPVYGKSWVGWLEA